MRGEDDQPPVDKLAESGSPPHARGRRPAQGRRVQASGITPACAGKTALKALAYSDTADHPRMRGEDLLAVVPEIPEGRITPACAGKTPADSQSASASADHPRMRGEDPTGCPSTMWFPGSPPHARGRRPSSASLPLAARITPACAGKTGPPAVGPRANVDHPRMRGEDGMVELVDPRTSGSPPHARGRRERRRGRLRLRGITPACAGKTRSRS